MFTDGTSESSAPAEEAAQPVSCIVKLKNETIEVKAEAPAGVLPNGTQMIVKAVENNTEDAELTDQYNKLAAKITEQLQSQGKNLDGFLAYNVSFTDADGNPVEPSDKVTYSFIYKEASSPELTDPAAFTVTAAMIRTNKETSELELTELKAEEDKLTVETNESRQLTKAAFQSAATAAYTFVWSSTPAADDNENTENKEENGEVNNEEVNADTNTENTEENGEETNTENNVENSEEEQNQEETPDQEQTKMIRVIADEVNLRVVPSTEAEVIATVDTDTQLPLLETANRKVKKRMSGAYDLYFNQQSEDGKFYLFTRQSYTEFRELWWSKNDFTRPVRITNTNPQQENYLWGSVQLVEWTNFEGKSNRGLLYLPENYDSTKRYPVIVNFYETHTGDLHTYQLPSLSSAMINTVTYVSNGYVVFMPDVHFTIGAPGESCYNAVVSGTQMLIDRGIADKDRIGVQGHSWSGYQVAYLVTRTNMFKCASPGAAVSNMVSAYTGVRTGSGMPRMFMYEETQSRMGKTLWDDPEAYIKNSPIFYADKIQTPLLIFHCDGDEAVPYSEGLNLFLAMRRLHKPAWLLNYKGDRHFLYNKAAEIDWTIRLRQFFDYYLKDAPMPRWMKEGINVNERGVDQKYDFVK